MYVVKYDTDICAAADAEVVSSFISVTPVSESGCMHVLHMLSNTEIYHEMVSSTVCDK